jgi:hypothetical protein
VLSFFIMDGKSTHFYREQRDNDSLDLHKGRLLDPTSPAVRNCVCWKLQLATNANILLVDQKAKIPGYDNEIWFSDKGIANVLSFKHTKASGLWIEYDCGADHFPLERKRFNGHPDMVFQMHDWGLHHWEDPNAFCLLNNIEENMQQSTQQEI